jgi:predicted metalloprotease with PDZ domain
VLFFHSGAHGDYHQPSDTADKLDLAGMARIAGLGAALAARIAEGPRPVFARVPDPAPRSARGAPDRAGSRPDGAFLGIGADVRAGGDGVRIGSIVPGSAAERAGLRPGDVLVQLAGAGLHGFPELREQLGRRRPGETVAIVYLREGLDHETRAMLGTRP